MTFNNKIVATKTLRLKETLISLCESSCLSVFVALFLILYFTIIIRLLINFQFESFCKVPRKSSKILLLTSNF